MKTSHLIREHRDTIINQWIREVKKDLPEARDHGRSALEDDVPTLLDKMVRMLEDKHESIAHASEKHGRLRALFDNYSLLHVIREYRILKRVLLKLLDAKGRIRIKERNIILYAIDESIEQASEVFFQIRTKIEVDAREKAEGTAIQLMDQDNLRKQFIEGLSHDMKNPITNIKLVIELLMEQLPSGRGTQLLSLLKKNTERTEILLNSLMNVNLVNSEDGLPLHLEKFDLMKEVESFISDNKINEHHPICLDACDAEVYGCWDREAIIRALGNLVQNAIRYGSDKKPITIGCSQDNGLTQLLVHNHGEVIPYEEQAKIFSRLYRIDSNNGKGQGLGLAVVKEVVEAHGGKIEIRSFPELGTTFTMTLPNDASKFQKNRKNDAKKVHTSASL